MAVAQEEQVLSNPDAFATIYRDSPAFDSAEAQLEDEAWQAAEPQLVERLVAAQHQYLSAMFGESSFELSRRRRSTDSVDRISLGFLRDRRFRVVKPIPVRFTTEDDTIIAEAKGLNEFGYGRTRNDAVGDLQQAIVSLYVQLLQLQQELGEDLSTVWRRLQQFVEFNER